MGIIVALQAWSSVLFLAFPVQAFHLPNPDHIPIWVILSAHAAIGHGTMAGGRRLARTMGHGVPKPAPAAGLLARTSGANPQCVHPPLGRPVSTHHPPTGASAR